MNTEFSTCTPVVNPFAYLVDSTASFEAHARMSTLAVQTVIHRPLEDRLFRQLGAAAAEDFDAEADADVGADEDVEEHAATRFGPLTDIVKPGNWTSGFAGHQSV